eukprot:TRINITY_DN75807_c0_g1_i1.p1 TRINITY_DN75807_c0_g1~~TRINITY_DN75807_c0_g1_i1.p1  ORF type:complete len:997 (-),score=178.96 TRINITY_DN75807_c0_g1_i1:49-3039(-)
MREWDDCPNSPKVRSRKKRTVEKRAHAYEVAEGEQLFCIDSRREGRLLLRSSNSFAYVHDAEARFSEGVQGKCNTLPDGRVELQPQSFGFCYAESFDVEEIVGVCYTVTLSDQCDENGIRLCILPEALQQHFSWLDPSKEEKGDASQMPTFSEVQGPISVRQLGEMECPCSPKIAGRTRQDNEKRAFKYKPAQDERLYCLDSHRKGVLLLRPDESFAYVHAEQARFSEGVQGKWSDHSGGKVELRPEGFGYCYWDSFDDSEVIDVCHVVALSDDRDDTTGRLLCYLPEELANKFSWLDPDREEELDNGGSQEHQGEEEEECPNSPKVPNRRSSKRRGGEKRASAYETSPGEQLYQPESHVTGVLLLKADFTFAYVHDSHARFSEGVQGDWSWSCEEERKVNLKPTSFGYSYVESFDENEIIGVCHEITLTEDRCADGKLLCLIPDDIKSKFSWLDPSREEDKEVTSRGTASTLSSRPAPLLNPAPTPRRSAEGQTVKPDSRLQSRRPMALETKQVPSLTQSYASSPVVSSGPPSPATASELDEEGPNSPKVRTRKRRTNEKKARAYECEEGEQLFCPETHQAGLLLLRPNGSFAYVHDFEARFSEGVQGKWSQLPDSQVLLDPKSFGYCYVESFDEDEIIGVPIAITLKRDSLNADGKPLCVLQEKLQTYLSWLDPTKPECPDGGAILNKTAHPSSADPEESPCSPKIAGRTRKDNEKRAFKYVPAEGERLYCLESHRSGVLLLRPDSRFAYVHSDRARFSEGVQGEWSEQPGNRVELYPTGFGYCYWDSFDASEIIGVCHVLALGEEHDPSGRLICRLNQDLANKFTWLDPDREEILEVGQGQEQPPAQQEEECPNSPKVPTRKKRNAEKRANAYVCAEGERLFSPESHAAGVLLLRPNSTFAYVFDSSARFSEGVQGDWSMQDGTVVKLEPTTFGYSYAENFDANEIVGVCYSVTLCSDMKADDGNLVCVFQEEQRRSFSWLDPTKQEPDKGTD